MSKPHYLYSFRRCPYAMRARMALCYAAIAVIIEEVSFKNKPEKMLELSPKGSVPVLVLNEGTVIDESLDIMLWALEQHDPNQWGGYLEESQALIAQNDGVFKQALDRYKYPNRYPDEDCTHAREKGIEFLNLLNARLQQQKYLSSNFITLADIAIFPFIRQFAHVDKEWFYAQNWQPLTDWLDKHLQSDLFKTIMDKNLVVINHE